MPPDSAVGRATNPDWQWGLPEHLLAGIYDMLAAANWQRGGDKNTPRPKPLPRPGVKRDGEKYGKGRGRPLLEAVEFHRRWAAGELEATPSQSSSASPT